MTDLTEVHIRRLDDRIDMLTERVEALEKRYVELVESCAQLTVRLYRLETKGPSSDAQPGAA